MQHTNCSRLADEWYAFRVRPRHEKSVALYLRDKGISCFSPLVRKSRYWAKRIVQVELPIICGYVFCRCDRSAIAPILRTPGIVDVVRSGAIPVPIPDAEIGSLEQAIRTGVPIEVCSYIETGRQIHVQSGPLAGIVGIVNDLTGSDQIILSISLLRRSVLVQVEAGQRSDSGSLPLLGRQGGTALGSVARE